MSFFTGSRIYGTPKPESDLDLCLLVTDREYDLLAALADRSPDHKTFLAGSEAGQGKWNTKTRSFRFGRLNILATTDTEMYRAWKSATEGLQKAQEIMGPVSREQAVAAFQKYEKEVK